MFLQKRKASKGLPIEEVAPQLQIEKAEQEKATAAQKVPDAQVVQEKAELAESLKQEEAIALKTKAEEDAGATAIGEKKQLKVVLLSLYF